MGGWVGGWVEGRSLFSVRREGKEKEEGGGGGV